MSEIAAPDMRPPRAKSVQDHIDELPIWPDGTPLRSPPMTSMQWFIWSLAAAGKFFEGFVVFMTGVALPLLSREFAIRPAEEGAITAATLFGILIGAVGLGGMSDRFGRKVMLVVEMVIFVAFLAALVFAPNFYLIVLCLFGIGLALGCDYPTAHMIISENIPSRSRGRLVLGAFAFQALGAGGLVGIAGDETDPTVAQIKQMAGHGQAGLPVVDPDVDRIVGRLRGGDHSDGQMRRAKSVQHGGGFT